MLNRGLFCPFTYMKKIVLAFDSFKGCITAKEACDAAAMGVLSVCPEATVVQMPMSDGGKVS